MSRHFPFADFYFFLIQSVHAINLSCFEKISISTQ